MTDFSALGRIVVTGAGGFIGGRLFRRLQHAGAQVRGWTRADVDLLDDANVAAAIARDRPDTIFHLAAAGVSPSRVFDVDVIRQDVTMTEHLLRHAFDGTRFLYSGSMSEYGRAGLLREGDICTPHTAYGIAKLASGLYASGEAHRRGDLRIRIARLFGVYGQGEAPARFFPFLLKMLDERTPMALSDGVQQRDFIHVDDACDAMIALIGSDGSEEVVNVGTGVAVRVRDAAEWIADAAGAPRELLGFGQRARSPNDEELMLAEVSRLKAMIGWVPPQRLKPGLDLSIFRD